MKEKIKTCVCCETCHGCGASNYVEVTVCDNCGCDAKHTIDDNELCSDCLDKYIENLNFVEIYRNNKEFFYKILEVEKID